MEEKIREDYFRWLTRSMNIGDYNSLLRYLFGKEFYWTIENDENRAEDGKELRRYFLEESSKDYDSIDPISGPCSVLEMLVALADRIDGDLMWDYDLGKRTDEWFWMMVFNLELEDQIDFQFDQNYTDEIITRFLDREYDSDGKGGIFPLNSTENDQRKQEIWYQMQEYVQENYE